MDVTKINLNRTGVTGATLDADGNGTLTLTSTPPLSNLNGGEYCFLASGTFGSGRTLTLQHKVGDAFEPLGLTQFSPHKEDVYLHLHKVR